MSKERRRRFFEWRKRIWWSNRKKRGQTALHDAAFLVEPRQTLHPSRSRSAFKAERPKRQITGSKQAIAIEGSSFRSKADICRWPSWTHCILHMYLNLAPVAATQGDGGWGGEAASNKCRRYYLPFCWLFAFSFLWTSNWTTAPRRRLGLASNLLSFSWAELYPDRFLFAYSLRILHFLASVRASSSIANSFEISSPTKLCCMEGSTFSLDRRRKKTPPMFSIVWLLCTTYPPLWILKSLFNVTHFILSSLRF